MTGIAITLSQGTVSVTGIAATRMAMCEVMAASQN